MDAQANATSLPIDFNNLGSPNHLYFFLCLGLALFVVFIFGMKKFGEATVERSEDDFITQLLPQYLATPDEYFRALMFYLATLSVLVAVISLLGPRVVGLGTAPVPDIAASLPLFVALVLVGVLPNVPWLQQLELLLRRFAHERAFIPTASRAVADTLAAAEFNFALFDAERILRSPKMRGVESADFTKPRDSIEYSWARLSCLLWELQRRQDSSQIEPILDGELLQRYASDLDSIALRRKSLEEDIAQYRREKLADAFYTNDQLHRTIRKTLRQLYVLLGCAVRLRLSPNGDLNAVMRPFGFLLNSAGSCSGNQNLMIVALAAVSVAVGIMSFAALGAASLLGRWGLWTPSDNFPTIAYAPFIYAVSVLLWSGTALLVADRVRAKRLAKGRWFAASAFKRKAIGANYIRIAFICAVPGFLVQYLWGLVTDDGSLAFAREFSPHALLPAVTGAFYAYHLDNVELGTRPSRGREIGLHALVTGCCWVAASSAWLALMGSSVERALDLLAFSFLAGVVVGGGFGYYVPAAAERNRVDPLLEAHASRIATLKDLALGYFGSQDAAQRWLEQPNPQLDRRSPIDAADDIPAFEKAVSLMQARKPALVA